MAVYVGVDFHVHFQTLCWCGTADGVIYEASLDHRRGVVRAFYRQWAASATVGMETSGYAGSFHRVVEETGHRLLVGDAYAIRQFARRRQKNDRRDAELLLDLPLRGDFPTVRVPGPANQDVLRLLRHRERLVRMRTMLKNSLQALAVNHRVARGRGLFTGPGGAAER